MNSRLQQFLVVENLSQSQFADAINVARASVSHVLAGRNKPGYDFLKSITETYPQLNLDWLMTGKGKMYKSSSPAPAQAPTPIPAVEPQVLEIPKFETKAVEPDVFGMDSLFSSSFVSSKIDSPAASVPVSEDTSAVTKSESRKVVKVVLLFDDGTYQELK